MSTPTRWSCLRPFLLFALLPTLQACSSLSGPAYTRPSVPNKSSWAHQASTPSPREVIRPDWWAGFEDQKLNELVQRAVAGNYDLKIMGLRLAEAGVTVETSKAGLLPRITSGTSASNTTAQAGNTQQYASNFSLNWELDIWGKIRKGIQAEQAGYKASAAQWRGAYLKLVADIASRYFQLRQLDKQMTSKQTSLDNNRFSLKLFRQQFDEGLVSSAEVLKQESEVESAEKDLLDLQRERAVTENNLAVLLGLPAGHFHIKAAPLHSMTQIPVVPVGLPSELLARRPDLIEAEYQILKAHHLLGKARLAKLPTISMTAQGGFASAVLSGFLKSWTFGLGPTINFPIFDPSVKLQIKASEAQIKTSEATYRGKIITAFSEVENALINLASHKQQKTKLESQVSKLALIRDQVTARLKEGLATQLEILEAERSLIETRLSQLSMHQQVLTDTVTLYKALGGGWPQNTPHEQ